MLSPHPQGGHKGGEKMKDLENQITGAVGAWIAEKLQEYRRSQGKAAKFLGSDIKVWEINILKAMIKAAEILIKMKEEELEKEKMKEKTG